MCGLHTAATSVLLLARFGLSPERPLNGLECQEYGNTVAVRRMHPFASVAYNFNLTVYKFFRCRGLCDWRHHSQHCRRRNDSKIARNHLLVERESFPSCSTGYRSSLLSIDLDF
ncbi:hypothetical protein FA95DRAFT_777355 [Auriscalpium vulgare]|uniref:Uncharacterized protein n=1 Tax=Auriscalpium vulgare TaxID=40419 RepID=A0ACB8S1A6_9AGAM|nr:hypothetical protein FA95DRAFT_777355 [Auriscalpium vulgare]